MPWRRRERAEGETRSDRGRRRARTWRWATGDGWAVAVPVGWVVVVDGDCVDAPHGHPRRLFILMGRRPWVDLGCRLTAWVVPPRTPPAAPASRKQGGRGDARGEHCIDRPLVFGNSADRPAAVRGRRPPRHGRPPVSGLAGATAVDASGAARRPLGRPRTPMAPLQLAHSAVTAWALMPAKSRPLLTALSVAAVGQEWGSPLLGASRRRYAKGIADGAIASFFVFSALPPTMVSHTGGNGGGVESAHVPCGRGAGKAPHPRWFS